MYTETEAIVLKQTKISSGRRMIVLFSKLHGKISAGTSISERSKNRAALALRPFVHGKYQIRRTGSNYHINGCETISSHYSLGEDIDKFICASYAMEFTNKILPEEAAEPRLFTLFADFLNSMERRDRKHETLLIAYQIKVLDLLGNWPRMESCVFCGSNKMLCGFIVEEGGMICEKCTELAENKQRLIYKAGFDIVNVINFLLKKPLSQLENLALDDHILKWIKTVLKGYIECHLDIGDLKSEECMNR